MKSFIGILFIMSFSLLTGCFASTTENPGGKEKMTKTTQVQNLEITQDSSEKINLESSTKLKLPEGLTLKDERVGIIPYSIEIPAINVQAMIEEVGRLDNGQMGVPHDDHHVGWFEPGAKPGERGNAVLAGHVDSKTGPAVFYKLDQLKKGDEIIVQNQEGKSLTFLVVGSKAYPRNNAPVEEIFDFSYGSRLNLITCTGDFNREAGTHEQRLVVYAELMHS